MGWWENVTAPIRNADNNPIGAIGAIGAGLAGGGIAGLPGLIGGGLVGGSVGTEAGKVLGVNSEDPTFNQPDMSPSLVRALADYRASAGKEPGEISKSYMEGVPEASKSLGFDPTSEALSSRAKRTFDRSAGDLNRQSQLQGVNESLSRKSKLVTMNQNILDYKRGLDAQISQYQIQAEATRNEVMGSLFGSVGGAIGYTAGKNKHGSGGDNLFSGKNYAGVDYNPNDMLIGSAVKRGAYNV